MKSKIPISNDWSPKIPNYKIRILGFQDPLDLLLVLTVRVDLARVSIPVSFDLFLDCCQMTELDLIPSDKHLTALKGFFSEKSGVTCLQSASSHILTLYSIFLSCCFMCLTPQIHERNKKMFTKCKFLFSDRFFATQCNAMTSLSKHLKGTRFWIYLIFS